LQKLEISLGGLLTEIPLQIPLQPAVGKTSPIMSQPSQVQLTNHEYSWPKTLQSRCVCGSQFYVIAVCRSSEIAKILTTLSAAAEKKSVEIIF
jgi:hypothetical protein